MNTAQNLEHLADAVEALVEDHRARATRIDTRRACAAAVETHLAPRFAAVRRALDELERAVAGQFEELLALEDAEATATVGPPPERVTAAAAIEQFKTILGGKPNGAG